MSLEKDFCHPRQYHNGWPQRIPAENLDQKELYVMMFELRTANPEKRAGKRPAYVTGPASNFSHGFYTVMFTAVNTDPEPDIQTVGTFYDGEYEGPYSSQQPPLQLHGILANHAYFRRRSDTLDIDLITEIGHWDKWLEEAPPRVAIT